jgi:hypothetical protein
MTAQELIDVIVLQYAGAPDDEVLSIGHWHAPAWAAPLEYFAPAIRITVGDIRAMAPQARAVAELSLRKSTP